MFSYREFFFGGTTFCCCLPVRMGILSMTVLGMLLSGILSVVLWFEVSSTVDMSSGERAAFVIGGLVETILFAASIFGFVGAIVRKQLFIQIYAYIIYVHFVLNVGVAIYLLYMVTRFSSNATSKACLDTIKDPGAQQQCEGILNVATGVYWGVVLIVIITEFYGAIIVTRYVNQLKREKRLARVSRLDTESAFQLLPTKGSGYTVIRDLSEQKLSVPSPLQHYSSTGYEADEFDPYREVGAPSPVPGPSREFEDLAAPPVEVGYGGGSWTHEDISAEEKARLKRQDREMGIPEPESPVDAEEAERRRSEIKSSLGPPAPRMTEGDDLPRYSPTPTLESRDREIFESLR